VPAIWHSKKAPRKYFPKCQTAGTLVRYNVFVSQERNIAILKLLNMIDGGCRYGVDDFARELEISRRTALRYIRIIESSGFPIYYDKKEKHYRFMDGYSLKKLNLSKDELNTVMFSGNYLRLLGEQFEDLHKSTTGKITHSVDQKTLNLQRSGVIPFLVKAEPIKKDPDYKIFFDTTARCYEKGVTAVIDYETLWSGVRRTREVGPYGIVHHEGRFFIAGFCFFRKEIRTFSFEGIHSVAQGARRYEVPADFSIERHFQSALGIDCGDGKIFRVRVLFKPEAVKWIVHRQWHPSQRIRFFKDGSAEVRFDIAGQEEILRWVMMWSDYAKIIEPDWLEALLADRLKRMLSVYE